MLDRSNPSARVFPPGADPAIVAAVEAGLAEWQDCHLTPEFWAGFDSGARYAAGLYADEMASRAHLIDVATLGVTRAEAKRRESALRAAVAS